MVKLKEEGENWEGKQALFCNYKDKSVIFQVLGASPLILLTA